MTEGEPHIAHQLLDHSSVKRSAVARLVYSTQHYAIETSKPGEIRGCLRRIIHHAKLVHKRLSTKEGEISVRSIKEFYMAWKTPPFSLAETWTERYVRTSAESKGYVVLWQRQAFFTSR